MGFVASRAFAGMLLLAVAFGTPAYSQGQPWPPPPPGHAEAASRARDAQKPSMDIFYNLQNVPYVVLITGTGGEIASPALVRDGPSHYRASSPNNFRLPGTPQPPRADLCFPTSIALAPDGTLYFAEPHSRLVRAVHGDQVAHLPPLRAEGTESLGSPPAFARPARVAYVADSLYVLEDVPDPRMTYSRLWKLKPTTGEATFVPLPRAQDRRPRIAQDFVSRDYVSAIAAAEGKGLLLFRADQGQVLLLTPEGRAEEYLRVGEEDIQRLWDVRESLKSSYFATYGIAMLPSGDIALGHGSVVAVMTRAGSLRLLAGDPYANGYRNGKGRRARFSDVAAVTWDERRHALLVADSGNHAIRAVTLAGQVTSLAGDGTIGHADTGMGRFTPRVVRFCRPMDVCVAPDGQVLVADSGNNLLRSIEGNGKVSTIAGSGRRYAVPVPAAYPRYPL